MEVSKMGRMIKTIDGKKEEIEDMGLSAIRNYFEVNPEQLDNETLKHLHNKAKIGMQFEKEMGVNKRAIEMNYLRVFRLMAEDKKELKKLIKKGLPQYAV
jgi:hypothetical protein